MATQTQKLSYPIECENCGIEYTIKFVVDEDIGKQIPVYCAFCGDEIVLTEEYDDEQQYEDDEDYD